MSTGSEHPRPTQTPSPSPSALRLPDPLSIGSFRRLFDTNILGIIYADTAGKIHEANDHFLNTFGYTRAELPLPWRDMTPPEWLAYDDAKVRELAETGVGTPWEKEYLHKDGRRIPIWLGVALVEGTEDQVVGFVVDISERKGAERELRASEERYKSLYDNIPLMYFSLESDGTMSSVNLNGARALGYETDELVGNPVTMVFHPDDRETVTARLAEFAADPTGVAKWEFRKKTRDGRTIWVSETVMAVERADGSMEFLVVCEDVTERKASEAQLLDYQRRLQELSATLTTAEEQERRRIGRGLHDDIGQILAIAKLKLGRLGQQLDDEGTAMETVGEIGELLDQSIQSTRSLVFELSSPVLYELGLEAALQDLGERVQADGLPFRFHSDGSCRGRGGESEALVYRTVRELVHNVLKHADASSLEIRLEMVGDECHVQVIDDGVGFDTERLSNPRAPMSGTGLFGIREQLHQVGGRFEIYSRPEGGTRAEIFLPDERTS